jgi:hypothetical protein
MGTYPILSLLLHGKFEFLYAAGVCINSGALLTDEWERMRKSLMENITMMEQLLG